ncbi:ankyrin repeat domain-containing protein [Shimazuella sp. AN120528]|uniref:ankyrin repeat domain-containing protein n=1 Tax=Shimazuella soli TaxID=1892854 RepID=UPI001F0F0FBA|nr:ankyrin repeat domain-containing protein [Shimazuella soli]MCH5584503.1 ankyrin repeat domain-containing protein [Shimazuella soli]
MTNLPPLVGLMYDLRHDNKRFAHLSELVMEKEFAAFKEEFAENDRMLDDYSNVTLLHMAAASGTTEIIDYLVQLGMDINSMDKDGNTPLHFAALCGHETGVNHLLTLGADKTITNKRNHAPWQVARTGKLLSVLWTDDANHKYKTKPDKSLYEAVETEDITAAKTLMEMNVHPNLLNHEDHQVEFRLPLHIAVDKQNLELAELLLENGAKPSAPYLHLHVPLENAIKHRDTKMAELLLRYGADPNHKLGTESLLHLATRLNLLEIMELLLQHGADPEAQVRGHYFYHPPLRDACSVEAIHLLIKYGAQTDPEKMKNFLIWPIGRGDTEVVKEFIRIGVPVDNPDLWNDAISGSRHNQMIPLCKVLLEAGLNVNTPIKYYGSPLLRAIQYRNLKLVKLFLEHGADVNIKTSEGYTPYEVAVSFLEKEISDLLAHYMREAEVPIPSFQAAPPLSKIKDALQQDHSDLIQLSLYDSTDDSHHDQFQELIKILGYSADALPFEVINDDEDEEEEYYEEWNENYQPPLSSYQVIFHPQDPRCFILLVSWYDDFAYRSVYHLHVRCEKKYREMIQSLFEDWFKGDEEADVGPSEFTKEDQEFVEHYKLGTYVYEWDKTNISDEIAARLEEVEKYYLAAVKTIHDKKIAPISP